MGYSYDRTGASWETAKSDILKTHPDMDPKVAKLYDSASDFTRATHAMFQNGTAGISSYDQESDLWEDCVGRYTRAVFMWGDILHSDESELGSGWRDLDKQIRKFLEVCKDRLQDSKNRFRAAKDKERAEQAYPRSY
jgi:hypothetical protein